MKATHGTALPPVTRRQFVQLAGATAAVVAGTSRARGNIKSPDRSFEHGRPLPEFQYGQVAFAPCLQQTQLEQTHAVLMGLDEDSLLKVFRLRVGLPAPGCSLAGWYSSDPVGGQTFGQWISALSRYHAITGDPASRAKVERLLAAFSEVVEPTGKLFGDPERTHGAAYHFDKLTCGLMDAHQFVGAPKALEILDRASEAVLSRLPGRAVDQLGDPRRSAESYTLPENLFMTWQRGGDVRYLEMGKQYLHHTYFDALARGENVLAGRHAYSHVNALSSAARAYMVLGDEQYLAAAKNGFAFVEAQSFATGGWGPSETFVPWKGYPEYGYPAWQTLGDSLNHTHAHFETPCGSYAHLKLTRYLLRLTRDSLYGDSMERVMLNTVLGARSLTQAGRAFYYSDYASGDGQKLYYDGGNGSLNPEWPCCSGTLPQVAADYRICTYFADDDGGVYTNLYIPSTLSWQSRGSQISLTQSGSYPVSDEIAFTFNLSRPQNFAVHLRIPAWAQNASIHVNGERLKMTPQPGAFATVRREWRSGDYLELELPRRLELKPVDAKHPNVVALTYGPLVLFAVAANIPELTRAQLLSAARMRPDTLEWQLDVGGERIRFLPFTSIKDERYSTYLTVS